MTESFHATIETVLVLLLIVFAVAVTVQWIRLPYTIALVLTGLFGFQPGFRHIQLTPDLILIVFLPVLLFESAYNVSARGLWKNILPITLLAVPGVLISMLITAALVQSFLGITWGVALLFGALISSTDPIAVVALFREISAPRRLTLLVEGESLFNDGAAITLFSIVLLALTTGEFSIGGGVVRFVSAVVGALIVGSVLGGGGSLLLQKVDNVQIQLTLTVLAAYGSYLLAETWGFSGAIAVVVTGLFFGNYGTKNGFKLRSLYAFGATWDFMGFVANSLIFLLIGIELDPRQFVTYGGTIAAAFVATLLGRAVAVYVLMPLLRGNQAAPAAYRPVLLWGGLRGAVSLALVLSVPLTLADGQAFPGRDVLQLITFGVVGSSLLLQGLTMRPLMRKLGLTNTASSEGEPVLQARLSAVEGALLALHRSNNERSLGTLHYERLVNSYETEHAQLEQQISELHNQSTQDTP